MSKCDKCEYAYFDWSEMVEACAIDFDGEGCSYEKGMLRYEKGKSCGKDGMRMRMISARELCHRICDGYVSHDGYVDGKFVDVFKDGGFDIFGNDHDRRLVEAVISIIQSIPEVDAVEVVRCKDCKWRFNVGECPMCHYANDDPSDMRFTDRTTDYRFCWAGERRHEDAND